jgi:hypothetical protein
MMQQAAYNGFSSFKTVSLSRDLGDPDYKLQRAVQALFNENLNNFTKSHQDSIGNLEEYPKLRIGGEEKRLVSNNLELIYMEKGLTFVNETLARNIVV